MEKRQVLLAAVLAAFFAGVFLLGRPKGTLGESIRTETRVDVVPLAVETDTETPQQQFATDPPPPPRPPTQSVWLTRMPLAEASLNTATDKVNVHQYDHFYDAAMAQMTYQHQLRGGPPTAGRKIRILDIGPGGGGSLQVFEKQFGRENLDYTAMDIVSCDVNIRPNRLLTAEQLAFLCNESNVHRLNQCEERDLDEAIARFGPAGAFDIIIDDAAHMSDCMVLTFEKLFPTLLKPGGLFIVEDLSFTLLDSQLKSQKKRYVETVKALVEDIEWDGLRKYDNKQWRRVIDGKPLTLRPSVPFVRDIQRLECEREICGFWKAMSAKVSAVSAPSRRANVAESSCPNLPMQANEAPARCPDEDEFLRLWLTRRQVNGMSRRVTIVDVGLNKGYTIASLLSAAGIGNTSRETVAKAVFKRRIEMLRDQNGMITNEQIAASVDMPATCGMCCDCGWPIDLSNSSRGADDELGAQERAEDGLNIEVDFYGFEPLKSNFDFLTDYWSSWRPPNPQRHKVRFHLLHAAVSAQSGVADFPLVMFGGEGGALGQRSKSGTMKVNVTTLNEALPQSLDRIDLLVTDTEGFDYFVQDGATRFLSPKTVKMLVFEMHGRDRPLTAVFSRLDKAGFECFFPVEPTVKKRHWKDPLPLPGTPQRMPLPRSVVNVSGSCWDASYDKRAVGWTNAVCIDPSDPHLRSVFSELSRTPREFRTCHVTAALRRGELKYLKWEYLDDLRSWWHY